jgi:predicted dehydrogenase
MKNIAIVGLGVMGKNHYRVLNNINGVKIVGLCDPVAKDEFSHRLFRDVDTMLNSIKKILICSNFYPLSINKSI